MLISIIMPAYNTEKYIGVSITSVLNQIWQEWELLIIDDCSKDHTSTIVKRYAETDKRIRLLTNSHNLGVASSRNRGVQEARGEWIAFLDSDDLWTPDKLALQIDLVKRSHAYFTFTGSSFIDEIGNKRSYVLHVPNQVSYKELLKQNVISCSSVLISKELLLSHPMKSGNLHEDFATWLTILRDTAGSAYGIDEPALLYRIHSDSKSAQKWKAAIMNWNVYRQIGLTPFSCLYYQMHYVFRNIKKYFYIFKN